MFLSPFGITLGMRKRYIQMLVTIFEFGQARLEEKRLKNCHYGDSSDESDELIDDELKLEPDFEDTENQVLEKTDVGDICFTLDSCLQYVKAGVKAIVDDKVTKCFTAEQLKSWNLLTRTQQNFEFISWRLTFVWFTGFFVRYFLMLPIRIAVFIFAVGWMVLLLSLVGCLPDTKLKQWLVLKVNVHVFQMLSICLSSAITFHNPENRPRGPGICVANHTTPIDMLVLNCDNAYSMIGQQHRGFLGLLQRALTRASSHIWFERSEVKDRSAVAERIREHIESPNRPPILIFPEGTCINNTSVMQFKKGSFEVGCTIYPVAIRYDPRFGDAFWDSSQYGMLHYVLLTMTSWAVVCDVWYLPPTRRREQETAMQFANRVKSAIARAGGLVDLVWDGQLKRMPVKKEWREKQQQNFTRILATRSNSKPEKSE